MRRYFFRRLIASLPTLFGISLLCFFLVQMTPGGPVDQMVAEWRKSGGSGESSTGDRTAITAEQREALVKHFGFDRPVHERYVRWLGQVARLDFGESYHYGEQVSTLIVQALPVSMTLGLASFFLSFLLCVPLGVAKAVRDGTRFDLATSGLLFFFYSIPSFALAIVLLVLFGGGSFWDVFPLQGMISEDWESLSWFGKIFDFVHHMTLPVLCYVIGGFATLTLLTKNSVLEQLRQEYVTAALAKGCSPRQALWRHAFRNALLPLAQYFGQWLSVFFTGSLLLETIFGLQGIGRLSFESIVRRDYPIVLAILLVLSAANIIGNLISDLLYAALDPRIEFGQ